ncbi:hypothetical protein [Cupriavidus sp. AcVe19-1a]|uniref:hypothetical protein n=1 Tax=Cupriavidus sp. AcVe19-1a TaxID=2821359 RepID=UPI001AEB13C6|nr:hypothetical protein [Cupriavidus sp. AcVe19-1a]MBP0629769.1 hypothetical protein [Cupriavidus sp. AcVe19-1a]
MAADIYLSKAVRMEVGEVRFQRVEAYLGHPPEMIATQHVYVITEDGSQHNLTIRLQDGCQRLVLGEPIAVPALLVTQGESA